MSAPTSTSRPTRAAGLQIVAVLIGLMWISELVDTAAGHRLDGLGIEPRDADGLPGIVLSPFLHGGFDHLVSNTIPLALLGAGVALAGAARVVMVTVVVGFVSGIGTWLTAPPNSVTVGASGIVFGYATYLISRGAFTRRIGDIGLGLLIVFLYGGALLGGLAAEPGVSWQAHLFGAIGGVLAARMAARQSAGASSAAAT